MTEANTWITVGAFGTGLEADMARELLVAANIPVMMHGEQTGIFGPGFQGWVPGGVGLAVPTAFAEQARELMS
ncbi:MAG: hypothetical protein ABIZ70_01375 [Gemmatimonadales bacterium]